MLREHRLNIAAEVNGSRGRGRDERPETQAEECAADHGDLDKRHLREDI
jgi:hypothetical protein